jgi:hypothetical protein
MGGDERNSNSEGMKVNPIKAEKVEPGGTDGGTTRCSADAPDPGASRMVVLGALATSTDVPMDRWPGEVLKVAIGRFARMPWGGWQLCHSIYCKKFSSGMSLDEFKRKANFVITSNGGTLCSRKKFVEESAKRVKTIDEHFEENTLHEAKVYLEVRKKFDILLKDNRSGEIDCAKWTRKFTHEEADPLVLGAIDRAAGDHAARYLPTSMDDIARLVQAAQKCFEEMTVRERKPSTWRPSIEEKIECNKRKKVLLERSIAGETLTGLEMKEARRLMKEENLILEVKRDLMTALSIIEERIRVYTSKIESHEKRKDFRKHNRSFELYRRRFYRQLSEEKPVEHSVTEDEIKAYWATMWNHREVDASQYDEYLEHFIPEKRRDEIFPSVAEFEDIIRCLPSWKAAGPDGIYNFFIKKCTSLHGHMYRVIREMCLNGEEAAQWFYRGLTYMIPKGVPKKGSDFRPITCMSNLYKLTTKCVTRVMQMDVCYRSLLAENQLGTVAQVQGAKEQALLNTAINQEHKNMLKTTWIDVKKAFDSIDHVYLLKCIERLDMPAWILKFLRSITSKWEIAIRSGKSELFRKKIERGILQGDSLSPLLFVLCIDPLSRKLNGRYPKVDVSTEDGMHTTNHLLFVDDLKLVAHNAQVLQAMTQETEKFFRVVGLEINRDKSATNTPECVETAVMLEGSQGYKYLGITEDSRSRPTIESYDKIKAELYARVERICQTRLNGKNAMKAINEHGINLINYYVGLLRLEPQHWADLDTGIRQILNKHGMHMQPGCLERLYLPRDELGRGLVNVEARSEQMLFQLHEALRVGAATSTRRAAILKVEKANNTHLGTIIAYLKIKYALSTEITAKILVEAQRANLYSEIEKKTLHAKLYRARSNELVSVADSSVWLRYGNVRPQDEARYCYMQDRNMFHGDTTMCPHCKLRPKTVDHLATQCDRMLYHDYLRRHNEVVRCIHLGLCTKYGIKALPRLRNYSVQEIVSNENVEIRVDTRVRTGIKIDANRPDILVHDKKRKEIILIEIGITSQDRLQTVETEKKRKYDVLANKLGLEHKCKTKIIPYVMTWDGIVTKLHRRYSTEIGLTNSVEAYIQAIVLKKTLESISFDFRRGHSCPEEVARDIPVSMRLSTGAEQTATAGVAAIQL